MLALPEGLAQPQKIAWFMVSYVLFDISYTIQDTPVFALPTVMISDVEERSAIIAGGKLWSMVGGVIATLLVPMVRPHLGWLGACIVFVAVSIGMMIPLLFGAKERTSAEAEENPGLREMLSYLKGNKYLIVALLALLILGLANLEQKMAIYAGRICLGREDMATLVAGGAAVSVIAVSALVPLLSRKWDKFHVLCVGMAFAIVMDVITYFVGYNIIWLAIVMIMLKCSGLGFWSVIVYMLVADTVEYGTYKTGTRAAGITFSLQCFAAKLKNALMGSLLLWTLSLTGFVEGEHAIQPAGVADGVWAMFCLFPAAGFVIALAILLLFYKLKTKDVQVMAAYNHGKISREEAEVLLADRYGPAGDKA